MKLKKEYKVVINPGELQMMLDGSLTIISTGPIRIRGRLPVDGPSTVLQVLTRRDALNIHTLEKVNEIRIPLQVL